MTLKIALLLFCTVCIRQSANAGRKAVKIVQEPANYGGLQAQQPNSHNLPSGTKMLRPFRNPHNFSGPRHLKKLYGACFSLVDNSYRYQLCPFSNVTQHEQTWRWNAFNGILGIWKEWSIVNNTFEAMMMTEGDPCPGEVRRQSKIFLKCAKKNKLVSVKEPQTCKYHVEFETPLACPVDAFLVYPLLSQEQQKEWEEIEERFYHEELTKQGYEKLRHKLFTKAGLLISPEENDSAKVEKKSSQNLKPNDSIDVPHSFTTKDECSKAYSELLIKYKKLVEAHKKYNSTFNNSNKNSGMSIEHSNNLTRVRGDHGTVS